MLAADGAGVLLNLAPQLAARLYPWQVRYWQLMAAALYWAFFAPRGQRKAIRLLVEMCRQAGKNEFAALWDACWLVSAAKWVGAGLVDLKPRPGGLPPLWEAVHAAPTYKPGITVAKRRLEGYLGAMAAGRWPWHKEDGQTYRAGVGWPAALNMASAGETATRRSLTANAYLRIDEVQHTSPQVYGAELAPMCSSTGAFTVCQGTIWPDSLGEQLRPVLLAEQEADGIQRVYQVPWEVVAERNPLYGDHVRTEMRILGEHHPIIDSEYRLRTPRSLGSFLDFERGDYDQLMGQHPPGERPLAGKIYVGGVDFCGAAEEPDEHALDPAWVSRRDNTCAVVGELSWRESRTPERQDTQRHPVIKVVACRFWPGQQPEAVVSKLEEFLFATWRCGKVVVDARGVGDGPAAMLAKRRGSAVTALKSGVSDVSRIGHRLLGAISTGRFQLYHEESPGPVLLELRKQFKHLRRRAKEGGAFLWGHPERRVNGEAIHDDGPKACGYLLEAAYDHLARYGSQPAREFVPWDEAAGYGGAG